MEIRNNTPMMNAPAFGMAFKKPSPELMDDFVDYVGRGISGNRAKKALIQLQEQQAGNKYFDIVTLKQGDAVVFKVVPKVEADKAQKMYQDGQIFGQGYDSFSPIKAAMEKNIAAREALGEKPNFVRKAFVETGCFFRDLAAEIKAFRNPIDELPGNLRQAAIEADKMESSVDLAIKKDKTIRSAFNE